MSNYDPLNSPLSLLPQDTVCQWLAAAMSADQELTLGEKVATASYSQGDGARSVTYTPADLPRLKARIAELSAFLGIGRPGRRGPVRVIF
jgi:hypothetical protein